MLQLGGEQDLAVEALERDPGEQLRREHLHHDAAVERLLHRQVGARHAAAAQLALEHVGARQRLLQTAPQIVHHCLVLGGGGICGRVRGFGQSGRLL